MAKRKKTMFFGNIRHNVNRDAFFAVFSPIITIAIITIIIS